MLSVMTHDQEVSLIAFSQDSRVLASVAGSAIYLWDLPQVASRFRYDYQRYNMQEGLIARIPHDHSIIAMRFDANGILWALDAKVGLITIDPADLESLRKYPCPEDILVLGIDIWRPSWAPAPEHYRTCILPDEQILAVGSSKLELYDLSAWHQETPRDIPWFDLPNPDDSIEVVARPGSSLLAIGTRQGRVLLYRSIHGSSQTPLLLLAETNFDIAVLSIGISPDESIVIPGFERFPEKPVFETKADQLHLWDHATGTIRILSPKGYPERTAFSPKDPLIAVTTYVGDCLLIDMVTGTSRATVEGPKIDAAEFTPDGKWLVTSRNRHDEWVKSHNWQPCLELWELDSLYKLDSWKEGSTILRRFDDFFWI
jgi:WD40 repeat protein